MNEFVPKDGQDSYSFPPVAAHVGYWEVGGPLGLRFSVVRKPLFLHRLLMRTLLGIRWGDGSV